MATLRVWSGATGAADGSSWADAYTTIQAAITAASGGDIILVDSEHDETYSSHTTLSKASMSAAAPIYIICVDSAGQTNENPTTRASTAKVRPTSLVNLIFSTGYFHVYGIKFGADGGGLDVSFSLSATSAWTFDTCSFDCGRNVFGSFNFDNSGATIASHLHRFYNCTFIFGNAGQGFSWGGYAEFYNCTLSGTAPTTFYTIDGGNTVGFHQWIGCDLSLITGTLVGIGASSKPGKIRFANCKLGSGVVIAASGLSPGSEVWVDNCDAADTNYRFARHVYEGSVVQETTIKRTGGASDGTTGLSWKMVDNGNAEFGSPLCSPWIALWLDAGTHTLTLEVLHDSVTNLQDDEAWIDIQYPGTSGFPISSAANDRTESVLATPADQTAGTGTGNWTTTGLTNPNSQKLHKQITTAEDGVVFVRACLAKGSAYTMYVCPKVDVS